MTMFKNHSANRGGFKGICGTARPASLYLSPNAQLPHLELKIVHLLTRNPHFNRISLIPQPHKSTVVLCRLAHDKKLWLSPTQFFCRSGHVVDLQCTHTHTHTHTHWLRTVTLPRSDQRRRPTDCPRTNDDDRLCR